MSLPARRSLMAAGAAALALVPAAGAAGAVSHVKLWSDKAHTVLCGIKIHPAGKPASRVICSAKGLHGPKGRVGDPFAQISARGRPHVVDFSQNSFVGHTAVTLSPGTTWSAVGVTCTVKKKTAKCTNKAGHGFTIGKNLYTTF